MKRKKRAVASIFAVALIVLGICCLEEDGSEVLAAGEEYSYKGAAVADYKAGKEETAYPEVDGMVFAGWYTDSAYTEALTGAPEADVTYYAKYVPVDVLSVKFQFSSDGNKLRFISSVDDLEYQSVGFELTVTDGGSVKEYVNSNTEVFKRINAADTTNTYKYSPKVIDTASEYMITATWSNVTDTASYMVKPYWITLDGTTVYGISRTVSKADYGKVNVTIEVSEEIAVGTALKAAYGTDNEATAIVIGYDAPYAHVKINLGAAGLSSATTFTVSKTDGTKLGTVVYRNLSTKYTGSNADTSWYTEYAGETEFVIATTADLYGLSTLVYNGTEAIDNFENKTIYLVSDITVNDGEAGATSWTPAVTDGVTATVYDWYPIGRKFSLSSEEGYPFKGTFDGQKHTISGLYMDNSGTSGQGFTDPNVYSGLFGLTMDSTIKNFRITNSYFYTTEQCIGSISGGGDGTFENIYSDVNIYSTYNLMGGIIGRVGVLGSKSATDTTITNCWYAGTITSTDTTGSINCGGLVGYLVFGYNADTAVYNNVIQDCFYTGRIYYKGTTSGNVRVGGLIGVSNGGTNSEVKISNTLCAGQMISTSGNTNVTQAGTVIGKGGNKNVAVLDNVYVTTASTYSMYPVGDVSSITAKGETDLSAEALNGATGTGWTTVDGQVKLSTFENIKIVNYGEITRPTIETTLVATISAPDITVPNYTATNPDADGNYYSTTWTGEQGAYFDGRYLYQSFLKYCYNQGEEYATKQVNDALNIVVIMKYDVLLQEVVATSEEMYLNHACDITYNSKLGYLVICHGTPNSKVLSYMDPETLEIIGDSFTISYGASGLGYNAVTDQYIIKRSNNTFILANGDFTEYQQLFTGIDEAKAYTNQPLCCDENYIYSLYYGPGTNKIDGTTLTTDAIIIYDWDGNFVKWIEVDFGNEEPENISVVDGDIYVGTGVNMKAYLYKISGINKAE